MGRYDVVQFDELEGTVKKVRRALGVTAFGVNYFDLPALAEGLEHNETRSNQEEVYVYVKGSGRLRVGDDEIEVRAGIAVRVDPEVTRQPIASDEGLAWVAIGAPKDGGYEPPSWG
jgi:mannose-6-phosphate isomerase-like protein (cupin superfamily)